MEAERIKTEITIGYKAINSKGDITLEIEPTTITVSDQSPEAASAHLLGIMQGLSVPASKQVGKN